MQFAFSTYESGSTILFIHNGNEDSYFLAALDEKGQLEIEDQRGNGTNWKADLGKLKIKNIFRFCFFKTNSAIKIKTL